jgi:hypothetical protein
MGRKVLKGNSMIDPSTTVLCEHLRTAKRPEDIFGPISEGPITQRLLACKHLFNDFIVLIHPDRNPGLPDAGAHVARLMAFRSEAEKLLRDGTYGKPRKATVTASLRSRKGTYTVLSEFRVGEVADLFIGELGGKRCLLKIVRQPTDNDLLDNEAKMLSELHRRTDEKSKVFQKYLPKLLDSFSLIAAGRHRRVNVLDIAEPEAEYVRRLKEKKGVDVQGDYYSLAEIRRAYPDGLDARDVAWMIRRTFEGLGWVHSVGYVHGAVLPEHVLVHPLEHGARLVGWSYAVREGARLSAVSASRKNMYPSGVFRREPTKHSLDVQLAGECAVLLLSDKKGKLRSDVPADIAAFFTKCRAGKIGDGWEAYLAFDEVLKSVYGKRAYRTFEMPR